jgi:uncharacterized PurR-regulated membrane protein YhhQ (DUF165 family)
MFKNSLLSDKTSPDFILTLLCMTYVVMVVSSIILFNQIVHFDFLTIKIKLSGAVIPYVFLYPISFIVLRVYGFKYVNYMIGAMILSSLIFVIMSKVVVGLSSNTTAVHNILSNSFKMYLAGFIGMPAGIYASFLTMNFLNKLGLQFNTASIAIATVAGEVINTVIVFPIGFHGQFTLHTIFSSIILDALVFKIIMGAVLAFFTILTINIILNNKLDSTWSFRRD